MPHITVYSDPIVLSHYGDEPRVFQPSAQPVFDYWADNIGALPDGRVIHQLPHMLPRQGETVFTKWQMSALVDESHFDVTRMNRRRCT